MATILSLEQVQAARFISAAVALLFDEWASAKATEKAGETAGLFAPRFHDAMEQAERVIDGYQACITGSAEIDDAVSFFDAVRDAHRMLVSARQTRPGQPVS